MPLALRCALLLALCSSWALPLRAQNAAALYQQAQAAEKAGQYQEALDLYVQARDADERYWGLDRAIGVCQVRLGLLRDATGSFDRYLLKKPEDEALAAYNARLKANLGGAPMAGVAVKPAVDGVTVFMKDNPRDDKHFRIGLELLTPLFFGLDVGYMPNRTHDFGLGWVGYSSGSFSGNLFHPRWRAHTGRFYWDSFFELGALIGGYKYGYSQGDYSATSLMGGNIGMGVDLVSEGPWVFGFLLSFNVLSVSTETRSTYTSSSGGYYNYVYNYSCSCYTYTYVPYTSTTRTETSKLGGVIAYPLIGMNMGLAF